MNNYSVVDIIIPVIIHSLSYTTSCVIEFCQYSLPLTSPKSPFTFLLTPYSFRSLPQFNLDDLCNSSDVSCCSEQIQ